MLAALDAMGVKELIIGDLENLRGCCALGAVGRARRLEMPEIHEYDWDYERGSVAALFGVAPALVAEIMYVNDECGSWRCRVSGRAPRARAALGR